MKMTHMYTINIILITTVLLCHLHLIYHLNLPICHMYMHNNNQLARNLNCHRNVLSKHRVQEVVVRVLSCYYLTHLRPIPATEQPYKSIHVN